MSKNLPPKVLITTAENFLKSQQVKGMLHQFNA